jgi:diguanylate cyclase (GGDEF)-like protein
MTLDEHQSAGAMAGQGAAPPAAAPGGSADLLAAVVGRDPNELLQAVVTEIGRAVDVWSVDLWSFARDADTLTCRAYWCREPGGAAADCAGAVVGLDQSHDLRRLVLAAEVVERHIDDDLPAAEAAALTQSGFKSRLDVPLLAGSEVLGVVSLSERRHVRRLTTDERERLGGLCRMAAVVLRTTALAEREQERGRRLLAVLEMGRGLSAGLDLAATGEAVAAEVRRHLAAVGAEAVVCLRQDDGSYARLRLLPGAERASGPEVWQADALARQAVDLGRVEQTHGAAGQARLVVPLAAAGTIVGYLDVTAALSRAFRADEVELVRLLADQAAAALGAARAYRTLENRSATDVLTGLYSRWYYYERLYAEVARSHRYKEPLTLMVAELDGYDDLAGSRDAAHREAVLTGVARVVRGCLRERVDVPCRLGAGRFALLLPNTRCDEGGAGIVAERVRAAVADTRLRDDELGSLGRFTMSLGAAGYPGHADDPDELAVAAEAAAARAAASGDCVVLA